jgi:hypothetical protein
LSCRNVDIKRSVDSEAPFQLQLLSTDMLHEQMKDRLGAAAEGGQDAAGGGGGGGGGSKGRGGGAGKVGKQVQADLEDDDTENQQKVKRPPAKKARKGLQESAA